MGAAHHSDKRSVFTSPLGIFQVVVEWWHLRHRSVAILHLFYGKLQSWKTNLQVVPEERHGGRPWRHARMPSPDLECTLDRVDQNGKSGD